MRRLSYSLFFYALVNLAYSMLTSKNNHSNSFDAAGMRVSSAYTMAFYTIAMSIHYSITQWPVPVAASEP